MRVPLGERGIQAVLLDIEGTTTPVAFVYDVLFPFARSALRSFIGEHLDEPDLREPLRLLREEWRRDVARGEVPPAWLEDTRDERIASIVAYAEWLMDRDRKTPALKAVQGQIWARGYREGTLHGEVFPDVPPALARWSEAGIRVAIFSSGSVLAQQMLFRTSTHGDLTRWISAFFDTNTGPKFSPDSYRRIASALASPAGRMLFISDTVAELDAARAAGCIGLLCVRPGPGSPVPGPQSRVPNPESQHATGFLTIHDFSEVDGPISG